MRGSVGTQRGAPCTRLHEPLAAKIGTVEYIKDRGSMRAILTAALVGAMLPMSTAAQADENRWSWSGTVGAGRWLRVASINGPIDVQPSPDGRVHVSAEKRWTRGDPRRVRF